MKTIFITITRGTLARNFLRAGLLDGLLKNNFRVVILLSQNPHDYFLNEFSNPNISIEVLNDKTYSKLRKFIIILFNGLIYTETEKRMLKYGGAHKKPIAKFHYFFRNFLFSILSKFKILKKFVRFLEFNFFVEKDYDFLFKKYHPDLLFCSSIYSKLDVLLIKSAKRFGIKSVSMPKSWDTVGRLFFRAPSDYVLLNNNFMKDWIIKEQLIPKVRLSVVGMPQFDIYANKKHYLSKEIFCNKTGLDPKKSIILFASEGAWTHWDWVYVDELIYKYKINKNYNFIIRPHFSNLMDKKYEKYRGLKNVYIDDENTRITGMFPDNWDPDYNTMDWTAEVIYQSQIVVTFFTTFVLDSFFFKKPVINIYYDPDGIKKLGVKNIPIKSMYNCFHYNAVLADNSTILTQNSDEVMKFINLVLCKGDKKGLESEKTYNKLAYLRDGNSSKRIIDFLLILLNED